MPLRSRHSIVPLVIALMLSAPAKLIAQSSLGASLLLSGRWTSQAEIGDLNLNDLNEGSRLGYEGQVIGTAGRWSTGLGFSSTRLLNSTLINYSQSDFFIETRYVAAAVAKSLGLYFAGRVGFGSYDIDCKGNAGFLGSSICETGDDPKTLILGGGGGLLIRLNEVITADIGAQFYPTNRWTFSNGTWENANRPHGMLRAGLQYAWKVE